MVARSVSSVDARAAERARMRRRSRTEDAAKPSNYAPSDVRPRPSRSSSKVVHRGYMSQRMTKLFSLFRFFFLKFRVFACTTQHFRSQGVVYCIFDH